MVLEEIATDGICISIAKRIAGAEWRELFNEAYLKMAEIQSEGTKIENVRGYFKRTIQNLHIRRSELGRRRVDELHEVADLPSEGDPYGDALDAYLMREPRNELEEVRQGIVELYLHHGNIRKISRETGICKDVLQGHLAAAKKEIYGYGNHL